MNEFLPIQTSEWQLIKQHIEQKYQLPWLEAMHQQFSQDLAQGKSLEFSEFEFLSQWLLHRNRANTVFQRSIKVPAPIETANGESSAAWFVRQAQILDPNCVKNATQCRGTELRAVEQIIRQWIANR